MGQGTALPRLYEREDSYMIWYEIYRGSNRWDVYKVTGNGQCYTLFKVLKTEKSAKNFASKHWVKRWA